MRASEYQLDNGLLRIALTIFREKHGTILFTGKVLAQIECPIDNPAFPSFPKLTHCSETILAMLG
jgi:hypothetical protein